MLNLSRTGNGIVDLNGDTKVRQFSRDIDNLAVANVGDVFLERDAQQRHAQLAPVRSAVTQQQPDAFSRNASPHAVVDAASREDHFGMMSMPLGLVGQV